MPLFLFFLNTKRFLDSVVRAWDPLHELARRVHQRSRAVCRIASTRNCDAHCCVLRLAALPELPPSPTA